MKIKICGITRLEDAQLAVNLGADAIGFIFYDKSKRYINPQNAKNIISELPSFIHKVGVFVNEKSEKINETAKFCGLTIIQLHGDETPEFIDEINYSCIKALRVDNIFNYDILYRYKKTPILLDSFNEKHYGGTGETFDWENIPEKIKSKIILAGGISEENLEEIFTKIKPYAIDISSSVEDSPGVKNKIKMEKLFNKIKMSGNKLC